MSGWFRSAFFVGSRDLRLMLRDREALLWTFVMPIVFFYFIGTVTGGFSSQGDPDRPDNLALLAPAESGFLLDELVVRLEEQNYAVARVASDEELQEYGRRLTVPEPAEGDANFTESVLGGTQISLQLGRSGEGAGVQFDQVRVAKAVYGLLADVVVAASESPSPAAAPARLGQQALREVADRPRALSLSVQQAGERRDPPTGYEQAIPGTLVMFVLLMGMTGGAMTLVIEREQGLLRRLASTPITRSAVVLGKLGSRLSLGLLQVAVGMLAGTVLFGMQWGAALPMIALTMAAWALFSGTLGLLLGNLARSEAQVNGLGLATGMALAALGGCWWPIEITPAWMQSLAMLLPTGWTMDAMHKLISFGYGGAAVIPHVLALLIGSAILGWLDARTFRYQ